MTKAVRLITGSHTIGAGTALSIWGPVQIQVVAGQTSTFTMTCSPTLPLGARVNLPLIPTP
jgi:H+/gluconate symporter-like permease